MGLLRAAARPFRSYFNNHFEMVKDEVRRTRTVAPSGPADIRQIANETNEIATVVARSVSESQVFLARQVAEVRAYSQLSSELAERVIENLAETREALAALRDQQSQQMLEQQRISAQLKDFGVLLSLQSAAVTRAEDRAVFAERLLDIANGDR